MLTIFKSIKGTNTQDLRILLLFFEDDVDVKLWTNIEEKFLRGVSDHRGICGRKKASLKPQPIIQYDFKTLYELCLEDIRYLLGLFD